MYLSAARDGDLEEYGIGCHHTTMMRQGPLGAIGPIIAAELKPNGWTARADSAFPGLLERTTRCGY